MFIAALFRIAKIWKQPKVSINGWIDKEDLEYYSALKRMESCQEGIMLSETSQTEKEKYCIISLICGF